MRVSRSRSPIGRIATLGPIAVCCTLVALTGCTRSIVAGNRIRPEPFAEIVERTEKARGIELEGEVDARVVSADELAAVVKNAASTAWPEAEARAYEASLVAMGLWPRDRDLFDDYVSALGSQVAGLYIPEERALFIVDEIDVPTKQALLLAFSRRDWAREATLTHELVHALQHQAYPDLIELVTSLRSQDDVVSALQAAIEGDAVRYGFAALGLRAAPAPVDLAERVRADAQAGAFADAPAILREAVVFPYVEGYKLATLEATLLLDRPPASTEQVLHVDKRNEAFLVIDLRPSHSTLPRDCELVYENTLGELGLSILFQELSPAPAARVWQGWDGDRYLVARCDGDLELVWVSAWDTDEDAAEFAAAYKTIAGRVAERAGADHEPQVRRSGRRVVVWTERLAAFADTATRVARETRVVSLTEVIEAFGYEPVHGRDRGRSLGS